MGAKTKHLKCGCVKQLVPHTVTVKCALHSIVGMEAYLFEEKNHAIVQFTN